MKGTKGMSSSEPLLMTATEAADILQINMNAMYKMLADGSFPAKAVKVGKLWRINRADFFEVFGIKPNDSNNDLIG